MCIIIMKAPNIETSLEHTLALFLYGEKLFGNRADLMRPVELKILKSWRQTRTRCMITNTHTEYTYSF